MNTASLHGSALEGVAHIGLFAGEGSFPFLLAKAAQACGLRVTAFGISGVTSPELEALVGEMRWVKFMQFGKLIEACHDTGVQKIILSGRIKHASIFQLPKIDARGVRVLAGAATQRADGILGAVTDELAGENIEVVDSTLLLREAMPPAGLLTPDCPPAGQVEADIAFGRPLAEALAAADVGQSILVKQRSVVAVEAMEGTDETITRAGELAGPGCVLIKVNKPNQDRRFDVPVVGMTTIRKLAAAGAAGLAFPGGEVLFFDREAAIEEATRHRISITAF